MRRWIWISLAGVVVAGGMLLAATRLLGLATIRGTVTQSGFNAPTIKQSRVVLLQGPNARMLALMEMVQPGTELKFEDGSTPTWTTTDAEGKFQFSGVRAKETAITALAELTDGTICATTYANVEPRFGTEDVNLELKVATLLEGESPGRTLICLALRFLVRAMAGRGSGPGWSSRPTFGKRTVTFNSAPCPCQPRTSPTPNEAWRSLTPICSPDGSESPSYSTVSSPGAVRRAGGGGARRAGGSDEENRGWSPSPCRSLLQRPPHGPRPSLLP